MALSGRGWRGGDRAEKQERTARLGQHRAGPARPGRGSSRARALLRARQTRFPLVGRDEQVGLRGREAHKGGPGPVGVPPACPQVQWTQGLAGSVSHTFSFPPQHRFLPCENKSEAVEQVKSAFSKVSCSVWGPRPGPTPGQRLGGAERAPSAAGRDCGNPTHGVTSSATEEPPPRLYLFSVKCLWGFLNDCSPPLQPCGLGQPAGAHGALAAAESDRGNRK